MNFLTTSRAGSSSVWNAQSVQAVWFVNSPEGVSADDIFGRVWEAEPENVTRNKIPRPDAPFLSTAGGELAGFRSEVQVQPGRVDIHVLPIPDPEAQDFETLDAQNTIRDLGQRMGTTQLFDASVVRVSMVAHLVQKASSLDDANATVFRMMGFDPEITGTDITFQFNSRKQFEFDPTFAMNRLMRYQSMILQQIALPLVSAVPPVGSAMAFASALTLDFNTVPDGRFIENKGIAPIFQEIAEELVRIAETGELSALKVK